LVNRLQGSGSTETFQSEVNPESESLDAAQMQFGTLLDRANRMALPQFAEQQISEWQQDPPETMAEYNRAIKFLRGMLTAQTRR
jgi:hypothetical protein